MDGSSESQDNQKKGWITFAHTAHMIYNTNVRHSNAKMTRQLAKTIVHQKPIRSRDGAHLSLWDVARILHNFGLWMVVCTIKSAHRLQARVTGVLLNKDRVLWERMKNTMARNMYTKCKMWPNGHTSANGIQKEDTWQQGGRTTDEWIFSRASNCDLLSVSLFQNSHEVTKMGVRKKTYICDRIMAYDVVRTAMGNYVYMRLALRGGIDSKGPRIFDPLLCIRTCTQRPVASTTYKTHREQLLCAMLFNQHGTESDLRTWATLYKMQIMLHCQINYISSKMLLVGGNKHVLTGLGLDAAVDTVPGFGTLQGSWLLNEFQERGHRVSIRHHAKNFTLIWTHCVHWKRKKGDSPKVGILIKKKCVLRLNKMHRIKNQRKCAFQNARNVLSKMDILHVTTHTHTSIIVDNIPFIFQSKLHDISTTRSLRSQHACFDQCASQLWVNALNDKQKCSHIRTTHTHTHIRRVVPNIQVEQKTLCPRRQYT